jgi:hypothetical protein
MRSYGVNVDQSRRAGGAFPGSPSALLAIAFFLLAPGLTMAADSASMESSFQALLSCAPSAHSPTASDRQAMRKAGASIRGFAMDGSIIIDDVHVDNNDAWAELLFSFPKPLMIDGYAVRLIWLERRQSGDGENNNDVKAYALTKGSVSDFAKTHQLTLETAGIARPMDIEGPADAEGGIGFKATYFQWTRPLSKLQRQSMTQDVYLPGPARYPPLRFAGAIYQANNDPATDAFAFGCQTFGPDFTPVDGL